MNTNKPFSRHTSAYHKEITLVMQSVSACVIVSCHPGLNLMKGYTVRDDGKLTQLVNQFNTQKHCPLFSLLQTVML